jgi:hypothetical protein
MSEAQSERGGFMAQQADDPSSAGTTFDSRGHMHRIKRLMPDDEALVSRSR